MTHQIKQGFVSIVLVLFMAISFADTISFVLHWLTHNTAIDFACTNFSDEENCPEKEDGKEAEKDNKKMETDWINAVYLNSRIGSGQLLLFKCLHCDFSSSDYSQDIFSPPEV